MKTKIILSILSLLFFGFFTTRVIAADNTKVVMKITRNQSSGGLKSSTPIYGLAEAAYNPDTKILDIEFFESFNDLNIEVFDNCSNQQVLFETIDTCNGLHILVDLSETEGPAFSIEMYNDEVEIWGDFWVE